MTERSAQHTTFVIDRTFDHAPARVFAAWSRREAKARWFAGTGEWKEVLREFDFRVGGRERLSGIWPSGVVSAFDCRYQDIVPDQRIVYTYDMHLDDKKISISLAMVEFKPAGAGTRLIVTEQGVFLDGYDDAGNRERGTRVLLDRLGTALQDHDGNR